MYPALIYIEIAYIFIRRVSWSLEFDKELRWLTCLVLNSGHLVVTYHQLQYVFLPSFIGNRLLICGQLRCTFHQNVLYYN